MSKILDASNPEVVQAVEVIAKRLPGCGRALHDLRRLSGLSQAEVAAALDRTDTAISHWQSERHWPSAEIIYKALLIMKVDARLLETYFPGTIRAGNALDALSAHLNQKSVALKISERIMDMTGADPDAIEDMIHDTLDVAVIAAQGIKGLTDARSAALFLERGDRRRRQRRQKRYYEPETASSEIPDLYTPQPAKAPEPPVTQIRTSTET